MKSRWLVEMETASMEEEAAKRKERLAALKRKVEGKAEPEPQPAEKLKRFKYFF